MSIFIGTAGWSISRDVADRFPTEGTGLERYAAAFQVAEINSSFHRPHRTSTWARWRDAVPDPFRFSVKIPKLITHTSKLVDCDAAIDDFLKGASTLGDKLAVLLVQLPPKLAFEPAVVPSFFRHLLSRTAAAVVCEPRHASWFTAEADALLKDLGIARCAADPAICPAAAGTGGWPGISYWRLHGSPIIYRSSYGERVETYARQLLRAEAKGQKVWCIFDNTASSAGTVDALALIAALETERITAVATEIAAIG